MQEYRLESGFLLKAQQLFERTAFFQNRFCIVNSSLCVSINKNPATCVNPSPTICYFTDSGVLLPTLSFLVVQLVSGLLKQRRRLVVTSDQHLV